MGLGIPLWLALIHFEKFGGDPMKRSISNMFTAYLGYVVIFTSFVCPLIKYSRVMIGCLPFEVGTIFVFVRQFASYMVAYLFSLIMMYKCLRLYRFHLTAWFIDDFLGPFMIVMLTILNILILITGMGGNQAWVYNDEDKTIRHMNTNKCLSTQKNKVD